MKILVLSDLHIEFAPFVPDPGAVEAADGIVLAGDISTGTHSIPWARKTFAGKPIIYIAGNHEFYRHHWTKLLPELHAGIAGGGSYALALGPSTAGLGDRISIRYLANPTGGDNMAFNVYANASYSTIWGDGMAASVLGGNIPKATAIRYLPSTAGFQLARIR